MQARLTLTFLRAHRDMQTNTAFPLGHVTLPVPRLPRITIHAPGAPFGPCGPRGPANS